MSEQLTFDQKESAKELKLLIEQLSIENGIVSMVSLPTCEDVIFHHENDLKKLMLLHDHADGIHPSKHIGYLTFWIRKLKPIAFGDEDVVLFKANEQTIIPASEEVVSVNEIVPIYVALHLSLSYAKTGHLDCSIPQQRRDEHLNVLAGIIKKMLLMSSDVGHSDGDVFQSLLYDMRYRTFGPHHLVYFVNHMIYAANERLNSTGE